MSNLTNTTSFELPPVEPEKLVDAFQRVLAQPLAFWESVRDSKGYGAPLLFAAAAGLVSGVIHAVLGLGISSIVAAPIGALIGSFVGGAVLYVVASVAGGRAEYEASVRIASYAGAIMPVAALLSLVPPLGAFAGLYGLYVAALGVIAILGADRQRTFIALGVLVLLLAVLPASLMWR